VEHAAGHRFAVSQSLLSFENAPGIPLPCLTRVANAPRNALRDEQYTSGKLRPRRKIRKNTRFMEFLLKLGIFVFLSQLIFAPSAFPSESMVPRLSQQAII